MSDPARNKSIQPPHASEKSLVGAWLNLASPLVAEAVAAVGFDWLLIDAEHGPNDVPSVLAQLQAVAAYPAIPVVRIPNHDAAVIKRYLDIGAHNLLVPMVDSVAQANAIVEASRYPSSGIRGVGAGLARASRWSLDSDYLETANSSVRVIAQIETEQGLENLEGIMSVAGIDAVFFGPADIAASKGLLGNPADASVQQAVRAGIETASAGNMPCGVFSGDQAFLKQCESAGARLLGVTSDVSLLVTNGKSVLSRFKP